MAEQSPHHAVLSVADAQVGELNAGAIVGGNLTELHATADIPPRLAQALADVRDSSDLMATALDRTAQQVGRDIRLLRDDLQLWHVASRQVSAVHRRWLYWWFGGIIVLQVLITVAVLLIAMRSQ